MSRRWLMRVGLAGSGLVLGAVLAGCPLGTGFGGNPGDTPPPAGGGTPPPKKTFHQQVFTEILPAGFQGPQDCLACHANIARDLLTTGHWNWQGPSVNIIGHENEIHGKRDLLNSFWIAVPANEGRCSQCHPSFGWRNKQFDFTAGDNVDCFICHDTTGTYQKHPTADGGGGLPAMLINGALTVVGAQPLTPVVYSIGKPGRRNCGACHFYADGGDNVKHGDLSSDLAAPTRDMDVHMGGLDFSCQTCHTEKDHGIAGLSLHSVQEGGPPPDCTRCHGATNVHTQNDILDDLINFHLDRVACETCHIPTFARSRPTRVEWYWSEAGRDVAPIPTDAFGLPTYDKTQGRFVWTQNVRPAYRWFNGTWKRMILNVADTYTNAGTADDPVVLAEPVGAKDDPGSKLYPFKRMVGNQPADTVNQRLLVPHLFGQAAGPNPYWEKFDWNLALHEGAAYAGQPFSGTYGFVNTVMYLAVHHEIAPKEQALTCRDCHGVPSFWQEIGLPDPLARH